MQAAEFFTTLSQLEAWLAASDEHELRRRTKPNPGAPFNVQRMHVVRLVRVAGRKTITLGRAEDVDYGNALSDALFEMRNNEASALSRKVERKRAHVEHKARKKAARKRSSTRVDETAIWARGLRGDR